MMTNFPVDIFNTNIELSKVLDAGGLYGPVVLPVLGRDHPVGTWQKSVVKLIRNPRVKLPELGPQSQ